MDAQAGLRLLLFASSSQGFSRRDPYDVAAQASWPPPVYAPDYSVEQTLLATMSIFISAVLIIVSHSGCLVWLRENILVDLQLPVSLYIFPVDFRTG